MQRCNKRSALRGIHDALPRVPAELWAPFAWQDYDGIDWCAQEAFGVKCSRLIRKDPDPAQDGRVTQGLRIVQSIEAADSNRRCCLVALSIRARRTLHDGAQRTFHGYQQPKCRIHGSPSEVGADFVRARQVPGCQFARLGQSPRHPTQDQIQYLHLVGPG